MKLNPKQVSLLLLLLTIITFSCKDPMYALRKQPGKYVHGYVAPGFEEVRTVFIRNFKKGGEIGASVCVYHKGEKVVDLWGGYRDKKTLAPWSENTMTTVFSATKGVCALAMNLAYSRGYFSYEDKVSKYWPEFAQHGKENITIRQLLNHEAGLVLVGHIPIELYRNPDSVATILADAKPLWEPGKKHGYHIGTLGSYMSEIIRRTDPKHRTIGKFVHDEFAVPFDLDLYIGLPEKINDTMIATLDLINASKAIPKTFSIPFAFTKTVMRRGSVMGRALKNMSGFDPNKRESWGVEFPSANGISNARNLAKLYSEFAMGGKKLGLKTEALEELKKPAVTPPNGPKDVVMGIKGWYSLGFLKPGPKLIYGVDQTPFGWPGAGGSFAFADPDRQLGYAYVMNNMDVFIPLDPRDQRLQKAVYRSILGKKHKKKKGR